MTPVLYLHPAWPGWVIVVTCTPEGDYLIRNQPNGWRNRMHYRGGLRRAQRWNAPADKLTWLGIPAPQEAPHEQATG